MSVTAIATALAGCSSSSGTGATGSPSTGTSASGSTDCIAAVTQTAAAKTYTTPPTDANPAAKGKKIAIVAVGMASPTVAVGAAGVQKAAAAIGWQSKLYDAKLDPAQFPVLVKEAVASKVDGIVGVGLDAPLVKAAVQQATAAGIPTISVQGWDLNDDPSTSGQAPVFATHISFGSRYKDFADAVRAYGATSAAWDIKQANCKGTIIDFANNEYTTLKLLEQGYAAQVSSVCPDCKRVKVDWLAADFGPTLTSKAKASFLQNPDAVAAHGATNPTLGITQAVVQGGLVGKVKMIGGFGVAADYDTVRSGQGLDAVNSWPLEWWAYGAVDTLNSYFNKTPARDEGLGFQIVDATTDLPPKGQDFKPSFDVPAAYAKSWGVTG
ncbi:MAG: ribose transport system substrate-binding protein [Frankiales bacterium]|jgi:ribose transport system substrate-binding protein|nr:ribose transport system substrate-binding protein [Frankiales bacterium]